MKRTLVNVSLEIGFYYPDDYQCKGQRANDNKTQNAEPSIRSTSMVGYHQQDKLYLFIVFYFVLLF